MEPCRTHASGDAAKEIYAVVGWAAWFWEADEASSLVEEKPSVIASKRLKSRAKLGRCRMRMV